MTSPTPPLPPDVTQQQAPAAQQYAQAAMQRQGAGAGGVQQGPQAAMQFVLGELKKIAQSMGDIAQVLAVEKPAVMPVLTRAAGMMKLIEKQAQEAAQGPNAAPVAGSEPPQAAMSTPEGPEAQGM